MRNGAKARENVKAEVKQNGKGAMNTLGLSAAYGKERVRARSEANMREKVEGARDEAEIRVNAEG